MVKMTYRWRSIPGGCNGVSYAIFPTIARAAHTLAAWNRAFDNKDRYGGPCWEYAPMDFEDYHGDEELYPRVHTAEVDMI